MKRIALTLTAWLGLSSLPLFAQSPELQQARAVVDTLCSREMAGRGYRENGHVKAAAYIAAQFQAMGLRPLPQPADAARPYFQPFRMSVNMIDSLELRVKGRLLQPGTDYIVQESSGSGKVFAKKTVDAGWGLPDSWEKASGKLVVVKEGLPPEIAANADLKSKYAAFAADETRVNMAYKVRAQAVILLRKKLTASVTAMRFELPVIAVREDVWPAKAKKVDLRVQSHYQALNSQNVIGWVEGAQFPDSLILVSAHYDHLGMQGDSVYFPGANDNASGIATLLSLARHFSRPENRPACSMAFVAFGGEEAGLLGSSYYVTQNPVWPLRQTRFVLNLDLMGNGDQGITAVAATEYPRQFQLLKDANAALNAVPEVKSRGNAPNSDHYFFVKNGVPALFLYTLGGPPHYHDVNDIPANLQFSEFDDLRNLLIRFLTQLNQP